PAQEGARLVLLPKLASFLGIQATRQPAKEGVPSAAALTRGSDGRSSNGSRYRYGQSRAPARLAHVGGAPRAAGTGCAWAYGPSSRRAPLRGCALRWSWP